MTDTRDAGGNLLPDAQRLTRLGRFLRTTSLDELPELVNLPPAHLHTLAFDRLSAAVYTMVIPSG